MPELKPIEVIMKLDFAESNGLEIVAHAAARGFIAMDCVRRVCLFAF